MGSWGTGIYQNDTGADVKGEYIGGLRAGKSDEEALEGVLCQFGNAIHDNDEKYDVLFALADVMWKKGRLTENIKTTALELIDEEEKTDRWESEKLKKARKKQLEKLRTELNSEMPERKRVSVHRPYVTGWEAGDVYYFQIREKVPKCEQYTGWYVLIYVDKISKRDWYVRGVYDEVPEIYLYLQEEKPSDITALKSAHPLCSTISKSMGGKYRNGLCECSRRERPKDLTYLGNAPSFSVPRNGWDYGDPESRSFNSMVYFGWRTAERNILWKYRSEKKFREENNIPDGILEGE